VAAEDQRWPRPLWECGFDGIDSVSPGASVERDADERQVQRQVQLLSVGIEPAIDGGSVVGGPGAEPVGPVEGVQFRQRDTVAGRQPGRVGRVTVLVEQPPQPPVERVGVGMALVVQVDLGVVGAQRAVGGGAVRVPGRVVA